MASRPSGMFIHSAQRQPGPSVNQPPSTGPSTEETPKTAPMTPMYLPRSRAGTTSAMMDWELTIMPPAPKPWMARPMMSSSMVCAKPPIAEPMTNNTMPPM